MRALVICCLLLTSCGAGAITGGLLGSRNRSRPPPEVRAPSMVLDKSDAPLVPPEGVFPLRLVFLSDYEVRSSDSLVLELRGRGVVSLQANPVLLQARDGSSNIFFFQRANEIRASIPVDQWPQTDVQCTLAVLVNGIEVAPPVPFTLLRQPTAKLIVTGAGTEELASVLGTTRVTCRVSGLRAQNATELEMIVLTKDLQGRDRLTPATDLQLTPDPAQGGMLVSGVLPSTPAATQAVITFNDFVLPGYQGAGLSTAVTQVLYRPEIQAGSPRHVAVDGGNLEAIFGQGLVPVDFAPPTPRVDFSRMEVEIQKGGRTAVVPPAAIRQDLSTLNRLVLTLPAAPDGEAGPASIQIKQVIDPARGYRVTSRADGTIVYGHRVPSFGPRGVVLRDDAIACELGMVAQSVGAPDLVTLSSEGGIGRLHLHRALGNGGFQRFGAGVLSADPARLSQRGPTSLFVTDLERNQLADFFVMQSGSGTSAEHTLVRARAAPAAPLALQANYGIADSAGVSRHIMADLDGNGFADIVAFPPGRAFLFQAGSSPSEPPAVRLSTIGSMTQADVAQVSDLDGDGHKDLFFATGGAAPSLTILYGNGDGSFQFGRRFQDLVIPGYQHFAESAVVAVRECGPAPLRNIVVIMSGRGNSTSSPPTLAVFRQSGPRSFEAPTPVGTLNLGAHEQILAHCAVADLDNDGSPEIALASRNALDTAMPMRLVTWSGSRFQEAGSIDLGVERMGSIEQIHFANAIVPSTGPARLALFVRYKILEGELSEHRVSTFLVSSGMRLSAADASVSMAQPIAALAMGNWGGRVQSTPRNGKSLDCFLATTSEIQIRRNNGYAEFDTITVQSQSLLPTTLAVAAINPAGWIGDSAAFLRLDGRLVVIPAGSAQPLVLDQDLRHYAPEPLRARSIDSSSRITAGDVDGDGVTDLVVMLSLRELKGREGEAVLLLLRGKAQVADREFPLLAPLMLEAASAHGNATSIALGDFAREVSTAPRLELAVAIPTGDNSNPDFGNHVRFYRYDSALGVLRRSYAEDLSRVLIAGDQPTQIAAGDMDDSGSVDLVVASAGDAKLRIFFNDGSRGTLGEEVNIRAFQESTNLAPSLPRGTPQQVRLFDFSGNEVPGVFVSVADASPGVSMQALVFVNDGAGALVNSLRLPETRTGNLLHTASGLVLRNAAGSFAVGDVNGDRQIDVVVGWQSSGANDRNLRVLFGGIR